MNTAQKITRMCVLCGADNYDSMFSYTYEFLKNVRGQLVANLQRMGWSEDVTSTIVTCKNCSCIYIRDVVVPSRTYKDSLYEKGRKSEAIKERARRIAAQETYRNYRAFDDQNWVVRNLVLLAADNCKRDIKYLDFGAGGGDACNAARVCGVRDVTAYDPNYIANIQEHFDRTNHPGIRCIRSKDELPGLGPFDAVMFQSAIEHVIDPRSELKLIYDNMSSGAYLYVNNPFMDLKNEIGRLLAAKKIEKKDLVSHYHPGHLNYMTPKQFTRLLKEVGFRITPLVHYPPVPLAPGHLRRYLMRTIKFGVRTAQNILGIPYARYFVIARKP